MYLSGFDAPTVWSEFTPLAARHNAVNLGQGFPDWETPSFAKEALIEVRHLDTLLTTELTRGLMAMSVVGNQ